MTIRLALIVPVAGLFFPSPAPCQVPGISPTPVPGPPPRVAFEDVTTASGLASFEHRSYLHGGDGLGGAAWFDYNNDGLLDLYLANGTEIQVPGQAGHDNALFENNGDGTFTDVASAKGATAGAGNSGVVAADLDNDGDQDLLLTGDGGMLGHCGIGAFPTVDGGVVLLENQGAPDYDYVRIDLASAGLDSLETTLSAAVADINFDGLLDLFITAPGTLAFGCPGPPGCCTSMWDPPTLQRSRLFVNAGGGNALAFVEVSEAAGGQSLFGALAAVFHDYNLDGRPDLFVGNGVINLCEPTPVELFRHNGAGTSGEPTFGNQASNQPDLSKDGAWMGFALGYFANNFDPLDPKNELPNLFVTNGGGSLPHAMMESNVAGGSYVDRAPAYGVGGQDTPSDYFGWGCTAKDFDLDGRVDLFFTGSFLPYGLIGANRGNPGQLLLGSAAGPLEDFSHVIPDHSERFTSGACAGDYDNDGRIDLVVVTDAIAAQGDLGTPILLRNTTPDPAPWLTVQLVGNGTSTNRDAVGARVRVLYGESPDRKAQIQEVIAGSSMLSMDSKWLTFGLGTEDPETLIEVQVDWPDGPQTAYDDNNWTSYGPFATSQTVVITQ